MSGKTSTKYIGKVKTGDRWFSYNQKSNTTTLPTVPGRQNLESLHIISAEDTEV